QIAQQPGAAVALDNFLGRAAEVQIDEVEPEVFHQASGIGQHGGTTAEELGRDGVLVFVKVKVASLDALVAQYSVGGGELGHDQAASAKVLDEAAEDGVGDPGHGSEDSGGGDRNVSHLQARREKPWSGGDLAPPRRPCIRVVPELLHSMILRSFSGEAISPSFPWTGEDARFSTSNAFPKVKPLGGGG